MVEPLTGSVDALAGVRWRLLGTPAADRRTPDSLSWEDALEVAQPAPVAAILRTNEGPDAALSADIDGTDWWYAAEFDWPGGPGRLSCEGVASHWEAWLDEDPIGGGTSMFRPGELAIDAPAGSHRLLFCCRGLAAVQAPRKPRAKWRSNLIPDIKFRWFRTTALGRIDWPGAASVAGIWRPVRLLRPRRVTVERVTTDRVTGRVRVTGEIAATGGWTLTRDGQTVARGSLAAGALDLSVDVPDAERWWPSGYGDQPCWELTVESGDDRWHRLIGFAEVLADTSDGGHTLTVNGIPVHARGVCWVPPDPLDPDAVTTEARDAVEATLSALRDAGCNLIRVTGTMTWLGEHFHDTCVRLGLLVWQDCMLHTLPPVDDPDWLADLGAEVRENLWPRQGQPHLVTVSGGSETEQQQVLWGLPPEPLTALTETIPQAVEDALPGVPYVTSTPSGGWRPTSVGTGTAHYFGVGAYLRPFRDARTAGVRFAAEALAFGNPPERRFVGEHFTDPRPQDPAWYRGIARDPSADWDFEQVLAHYSKTVLHRDVVALRESDPQAALEVLRATAALVMSRTGAEWRRPGSTCAGAVVLSGRDLTPGAGWGVLDSAGGEKSAWWGLRQAWSPRAILLTDEGLDSYAVHLVNDLPEPWETELELAASGFGAEHRTATREVTVPARSAITLWAEEVLGGFLDLTHAWAFGDATWSVLTARAGEAYAAAVPDAVLPQLLDRTGEIAEALTVTRDGDEIELSAARSLAFVALEGDARPADNWFALGAGQTRRLWVGPGSVSIRALNADGELTA